MDNLKELITKNKKVTLIIVVIIILFISGSAARFAYTHAPAPEQPPTNEQQQEQEEQPQEQEKEKSPLSDEQQALKSTYTDEIKTFISLLSANTWTASSETIALSFTEETFTEAKDGDSITKGYAISALRQENIQAGEKSNSYTQSYIASILVDGETFIIKATCVQDGKDKSPWIVSSECFTKAKNYTRSSAAQNFTIEGLTEDFTNLVGGDKQVEKLTSALKEYCAEYYPTARKAAWDATAEVDYDTQTALLKFKLDNQSKAALVVSYSLANNSFEIGKVA